MSVSSFIETQKKQIIFLKQRRTFFLISTKIIFKNHINKSFKKKNQIIIEIIANYINFPHIQNADVTNIFILNNL